MSWVADENYNINIIFNNNNILQNSTNDVILNYILPKNGI